MGNLLFFGGGGGLFFSFFVLLGPQAAWGFFFVCRHFLCIFSGFGGLGSVPAPQDGNNAGGTASRLNKGWQRGVWMSVLQQNSVSSVKKLGEFALGTQIVQAERNSLSFPPLSSESPKIEKTQDRPPGLDFSSETENFKRAAHQTPIFVGEFGSSEIDIFKRD